MDNTISAQLELNESIEHQRKLITYLEVTIYTFNKTYDKQYILNTKKQLKEANKTLGKLLKRKRFYEDLKALLDE